MKETILIVDDELHLRKILAYLLEQQGYQVLVAENGREALERAKASLPDLILLDLMMPGMDGYEVCASLREDYRTRQVPIIMVTAKSEQFDKVRGLERGANDYLTKPYDNKELVLRVRNTLNWSRAQRQANPLTGLPGNQAIEAEMQRRIDRHEPFAFLYIDVDNFKAYNDHYGYSRGDDAIHLLSNTIGECVRAFGRDGDFIGHIGGDDFCVVTRPAEGERLARTLGSAFEAQLPRLISPEDLQRGYFKVRGRQGSEQHMPFPSLTIAVVIDRGGEIAHWARVSDIAAELKAFGKLQEGNAVVVDRRANSSEDAISPTILKP